MALTHSPLPGTPWLAATTLALVLAACGGGSPDTGLLPAKADGSAQTVDTKAAVPEATRPPLLPHDPDVVDATTSGQRWLKAVGALDDGGHVVVWMTQEPADPGPAGPLWLQRYDAEGLRVGGPVRLVDLPEGIPSPDDVAVTVLPEGRVGVTFITDRIESAQSRIAEVQFWPFNLEGSINGMGRILEASRYARFAPRFARLAGPVTASAGRDGSHYAAWRFQIVGAPQVFPAVHAQRLASDGEPLGWIQRLGGDGVRPRRVDITPLDEGGWVVSLEEPTPTGSREQFIQLDVPRPLAMPQYVAKSGDSFLLDLRGHGSVLFAGLLDPASGAVVQDASIHFDVRGRAQPTQALAELPVAAVALGGGDYLTFRPEGGQLAAQRFSPEGVAVGEAFLTLATPGLRSTALRHGGLALAWLTTTTDGQVQVVTQRFDSAAP